MLRDDYNMTLLAAILLSYAFHYDGYGMKKKYFLINDFFFR